MSEHIPSWFAKDQPTTKHYLVCPNGRIATRIMTHATEGANIDEVDDQGNVGGYSSNDFPDMMPVVLDAPHVHDGDDGDFLTRHCRVVTGPADYSLYASDAPVIEPWPDEIVSACGKAEHVAWCLWRLRQFSDALPPRYRDDATFQAAMGHIIKGRMEGELKELEDQIAAFRKDRIEPASFDLEESEENA